MTDDHRVWAGALLFVGAVEFVLGLYIAEALFPGYNVGTNAVSDLGAFCRPGEGCVIHQPSSAVFTAIMLALGAAVLVAAVLLYRASTTRTVPVLLGGLAVGVLGAAVFNESWGIHAVFALLAFTAGSLAAVASYWGTTGPSRFLGLGLGGLALLGLGWQLTGTIFGDGYFGPLGDGGVERLIVYPAILWLVGYGASLLGAPAAQAFAPGSAPSPMGSGPAAVRTFLR